VATDDDRGGAVAVARRYQRAAEADPALRPVLARSRGNQIAGPQCLDLHLPGRCPDVRPAQVAKRDGGHTVAGILRRDEHLVRSGVEGPATAAGTVVAAAAAAAVAAVSASAAAADDWKDFARRQVEVTADFRAVSAR
jgi:hypothetical protein